ncbi:hypothetical protein BJV74DRAFT_868775 [Russula compacta]|nr:hypothetical protein BJV74DRAFT_868775 [Russula compacta]
MQCKLLIEGYSTRLMLYVGESMPTNNVGEVVQGLGEQVYDLLVYMQLPKFSEHLTSQTQTVTYILKLVENAALFAEDCSKREVEELGTVDHRRNILGEFDQQFTNLKRNFTAGKETYARAWILPYSRPEDFIPPPPSIQETRSEVSTVESEPDTHMVTLDEDRKLLDSLNPYFTSIDLMNLCCLDQTRQNVLSSISSWFDNTDKPNVLWLCGAPGTGKTAIAWSLIAELEKQQRSAGEFFFLPNQHSPYQLWSTMAYKMAKFYPTFQSEVYKALTREEDVALDDVQMTFETLIAGPLEALDARLSSLRPIFLIDGLEQCSQVGSSWQSVLDTFLKWLSLPRHCKLIITSRPQYDIARTFENCNVERVELLMGDDVDTDHDVRTYLYNRFAEMKKQEESFPENWPDDDAISQLARHTGGFFQWAAVAYLKDILEMALEKDLSDAFRATMGAIAFSKQPLTMVDLEHFLENRFPSSSGVSLEDMCHKLAPIISIQDESRTIEIRHKAYKDYLIDPKRCRLHDNVSFVVDQPKAHKEMTITCLKIMQQGLKFNICGLKSSYRMNNDIEDKEALVENCIPSYLAYACQYWSDHLHGIASTEKRDTEIVNLLRNFLNLYLLYWLEALSLLSKSPIAFKSLLVMAEWLEATDKDLSLRAADASRFSLTFADVISASAPHIYLSALPFAPPSSLVSKRYSGQFPQTIKVSHEEEIKWPAMRFSVSADCYINCISIHPDGKKVAAAGSGGTAMVFSVTMGETLFNLSGHMGSVRAIAYGPKGKRIATGCDDRRLRIFEAEKGSLLFKPFELHSDWIRSLAWSPDGQRIVTGSDDKKVKVVIVETGQVIYDTGFHSDWVRTVLFTTEFFISCSDDRTVRIYDASTGAASGEEWVTGQTDYIRAIAISPDKEILAAGSDDCSIMLYNMDTRSTINQTIRGHSRAITSLSFSEDGKLLASGSEDQTVRLWDARTGKKICDPLYGHTSPVNSVKFSPDTKQLVTGGDDFTIRFFDIASLPIWKNTSTGSTDVFRAAIPLHDSNTILASDKWSISRWSVDEGHVESLPLKGNSEHMAGIQSVSISPDGRFVATAANRAVIFWHADSGEMLCDPLEGHTDDIYALNFSVDSKMLISGSDDQTVWIWSTEHRSSICGPLNGHTASVRSVCFSPDSKQVASGSDDRTAIIWSVKSGEKVHEPLAHHEDWIRSLAYSHDGLYLATASDDYTVAIWDVATGERVLHTLEGHGGYVRLVDWSLDSRRIVTGALDDVIRIFDVETGTLLYGLSTGHPTNLTALSLRSSRHSGEPEIVSVSFDGTVRVWELEMQSFAETQTFSDNHKDWIHAISFSPVDNHIASGDDEGQLIVMDGVTGSTVFNQNQKGHSNWIRCVRYSPDGKTIATCSDDRKINIWNADNGERLREPLEGHTRAVLCIEFSPDGEFLVSGSEDSTVRTWGLRPLFDELHSPPTTYYGHHGAVNAVAYARGRGLIVSGSSKGEIAIWDGSISNECIRQFSGHDGQVLSICVFGEKIFSSSEESTIRIWDLSSGDALTSIPSGHTGAINAITLTPDGKRIISASDDNTLRTFDSYSGEPCTPPLRMSDRVFAVSVSHDGALVACGGADNTVHVWRANMARRAVWPDSFIREVRGQKFCLVDKQGALAEFNLSDDGWLRGSKEEPMCWIPSAYRAGLWTPRTVGILGTLRTVLDLRGFVHGTEWDQCGVSVSTDKA